MKISFEKSTFQKPLELAFGAIESRHALPILSNILVQVKDRKLTITGSDLEVEVVASVSLDESFEEAAITLPARKMKDIISSLPDGIIQMSVADGKAVLKSGKSKFTLSTLGATEYPNIDKFEAIRSFNINAQDLGALLKKVAYAMANQDVRYYLNGICLTIGKGRISAAATDGHRLALAKAAIDIPMDAEDQQIILPRKGALEMMRLLNNIQQDTKVMYNHNHLNIRSDGQAFTTKLIDGKYPDFMRVIPKAPVFSIDIEKQQLKESLTRVAILANEKFKGVRLTLSNGKLKMEANNPSNEHSLEEVDIEYSGEEFEIGCNIAYLIDLVNNSASETLRLWLTSPTTSVKVEQPDDDSTISVIMPLKL